MNEDKDIKEKESPMSSEDMFNSWSQLLNDGSTNNNTLSNKPNNSISNNKVQDNPFAMMSNNNNNGNNNDSNQVVTFPKVNSHNSNAMNADNVNNINNKIASLHNGPSDEKSNSVFTNIFSDNGVSNVVNAQSVNKVNEESGIQKNPAQSNMQMGAMQDDDLDTFEYKEGKVIPRVGRNTVNKLSYKKPPKSLSSKKGFNDEDKNFKTSLVFLGIIFFGIGVFIYNTINNGKTEEDIKLNNNSSSVEKKPEKVEKIPDEEDNKANNVNTEATQELKNMCGLIDSNGNYQNNLANVTDLDRFIETARYCQAHLCIYTKDNVVYTRNCQSGLEYKRTVEEMKVSLNLGFACIEYNKRGDYVDGNLGITCKDDHCSAILNGRSFNQNCKNYKQIK